VIDRKFSFAWANEVGDTEVLANLIKELIDYRLATYKVRRSHQPVATHHEFIPISKQRNRLPYFPNLTLAYDHFKTGRLDGLVYHSLPSAYGDLNPDLHFISRASDNSMKGDGNVINEGDFLLLERFTSNDLGTALDSVVAVEYGGIKTSELRINLRVINRNSSGETLLHALNLNYPDLPVTGNVCAFGKLITVIDRLDLAVGESFIREEIPALFSEKFSPGNWNSGHILFNDKKTHVLLVTLNKQGRSDEHRYHDYWIDKNTFH